MSMTLEQARALIGAKVAYDHPGCAETGEIASVGGRFVFVRYEGDTRAKATDPEALRLLDDPVAEAIEGGWDIDEGEPNENGYRSVHAKCRRCGLSTFAALGADTTAEVLTRSHDVQHEPGHALDIEVEWEVVASCSVCPDGGKVEVDEDGDLTCRVCGSFWTIEGKGGRRSDG